MILKNGRVITQDKDRPYIEDGAVVIEGNKIIAVDTTENILAKYKEEDIIDVDGKVIMPGFINTHHHIYSAFARGMASSGKPNENFLEILENLWWKIDKKLSLEDLKYSAYTTYIDCIKKGVTTVFDHNASPFAVTGSLDSIADAAKDLGLRTCLCYEVSDRDGEKIAQEGIDENINFIKKYNTDEQNMIKGMFGLHASFTLSDETLRKCDEELKGLNAGYHVHVAEGIDDLEQCLEKYGKRVVERLRDMNILGDKTIAVHCIHVTDDELNILRDTNTMVVHNPESNMGNAVGCQPFLELHQKGITIGLGTDGYTSDMTESMKVANIIHKHVKQNPSVAWGEVPVSMFENNRKIAQKYFSGDLGILRAGALADVIVVDYDPLTPMNENNINSHILFGFTGKDVVTTIIDGKVIMQDRKLVGINEKEIFKTSREVAKKLWDRM
ncbi:MAG: putative aminohydrolase SsnA [Fusobacterium mortiferum]|uniref:Aminohydrolase SsnA n=1 Tax=Fusobacterium mortiferum ATCC 9817 TaxID=469616 RepID=A0ABN5J542_FUSMR|nr:MULTISPECIES: putative aminohydrolase SsnA [Fusobacterium]AVQ17654.1 putative aminohydrolase SsnA [Fusobacterium mortiferum ATCC 9817]EEO35476.2 putative selenium metabolism protein SsnA [Fusobacterium mortiferum ATCC 9817]MCF2700446.1 putative aminohydrolase SsnA [Fusobacterium mortiferum]MCI7187051.1 putative aminohydrolase SsnA [Fusobacterium mortiferum]MCI7664851.1 putative aminohydrolase SsnA [Fusobacterium mortiferum]